MAELSPLKFFLITIKQVTVFSGIVNGTPADPFNSITWNNGATGTASSIGTSGAPVEGNTVFFGTTEGGRERGLTRLRSWTPSDGSGTAGTLVTAENKDVSPNVVNGDRISIKLFWQLWDKVPRQDASDPNNILFFEDFDIGYNQQTVNWLPMAVAGPPGTEFLEAGQAQISFVGDRSYALAPGATLSSFLWTAHGSNEGTSSSQGTVASPVIFTYPNAGQHLVSLEVTDSNGITHTNYTWGIVIDPADPTTVAYTKFDAISDNFDALQGGGSCNFTVHGVADVSQFPTETLVLHVARGTQTTPTATWPNRANILYSGYITGNGIRQDPVNNTTSFRTVSIDGLMKKLSIYPVRLSDSSNPQNWTQAKDLTVDRVLSFLAHWRSTLSLMTSIIPLEYTAELKSQNFNKANLFGMVKSLMGDAWGLPISDHQSVLYLVRDFNLMTTTERAAVTTRKTLHKGIWVAAIDIAERGEYEQPVRKVKWNGVVYSGDGVAAIPLFSEAPGDVMDSWGNEQARSGLILTTQDDLNTRTGFAYSRANQRYPGAQMRFLNDGSFTVAPQEIFPANVEAGDNNRGLVWTPDLIPRSIRRSYDHVGGFIDYQITFEPSVTGPGGITVVAASAPMPAKPPSSTGGGVAPPGDPPPAPPAWPQPTVPIPGPAVAADTVDGCYITFDSGASWERRNNLLINPDQLAMQYLIWDPWWFTPDKQGTNDPEQVILWSCGLGFVTKSEDAGKNWENLTQNIDDPPNSWNDSPAPTVADVTFKNISGDIHTKDEFYFTVEWEPAANDWRRWMLKTADDGVTWTWSQVSTGSWTFNDDFANSPNIWGPVDDGFGPHATYTAGVGFVSIDTQVAAGSFSRIIEIVTPEFTPTEINTVEINYDLTLGAFTIGTESAMSIVATRSGGGTVFISEDFDNVTTGAGVTKTLTVNETDIKQIKVFIRSSKAVTAVYSGSVTLNSVEVTGAAGETPGENTNPFEAAGEGRPLGLDVDVEDGSKIWQTAWETDSFYLVEYSAGLAFQSSHIFAPDNVTEAEVDARTFYISPYSPAFFGTPSLNDIIYVYGRWDDGTVSHLQKSTNGGATFTDIGDSATWLTGWVGAFFATDANILFAFVNGGSRALYRTIDAGATWTNLSSLPFDVDPGGMTVHPDGRILISNRDAGAQTAAYAESPDYASWIDATGAPSFPTTTPGAGSNAIIWIV